MSVIENKIKNLNIKLPEPKAPVGAYVATKIVGKLLYISGQISIDENANLIKGKIGREIDCVIEGRDIGSVVFPNADYKFFLTADIEVRALRRHAELKKIGEYLPIDEKHPLSSQSPYAASKIASDQLTLSYYKSFNLPVTILRPFNTYGPRQSSRAVIPTIISQIASGAGNIKLGSVHPG